MDSAKFLEGIVIGDALGSLYYGMNAGHISTTLRNIPGYPDTLKALKGHEQRWRKGGMYTAQSQLSLVAAVLSSQRKISPASLLDTFSSMEQSDELHWGVFRHPDRGFADYFDRIMAASGASNEAPSCSLMALCAAAAVSYPGEFPVTQLLQLAASVTRERFSVAAAVIAARTACSYGENLLLASAEIADELESDSFVSQAAFDASLNPGRISEAMKTYSVAAKKIYAAPDQKQALSLICELVSSLTGNNITRPEVEHPFAVLLLSFYIADNAQSNPVYEAARRGGASSFIAALVAAFTSSRGTFPFELIDGLVNRKKIFQLIEDIVNGKTGRDSVAAFYASELPLTRKELDEYRAKTKKIQLTEKKKRTVTSEQERLSRHVVESWTKLDRARWKKEKRKHEEDYDNE